MSSCEDVTQIKGALIKGKRYLVPVVNSTPVLLPGHTDHEFECLTNGLIFHYHYDWRFLDGVPDLSWVTRGTASPVMIERECYRETHPNGNQNLMFMRRELYRLGKCAKNGICGHKGLQIDESTGQCPGHGLKYNPDGSLKYRFEDIRYAINDQRVVGHEHGFKEVMEKDSICQEVRLVCGEDVISVYKLDQPPQFMAGDTFNFSERCIE